MADFSRDVRRVLREAGCYLVRQGKGDHEIWYSPITNTTFPVDALDRVRDCDLGFLPRRGRLHSRNASHPAQTKNATTIGHGSFVGFVRARRRVLEPVRIAGLVRPGVMLLLRYCQ